MKKILLFLATIGVMTGVLYLGSRTPIEKPVEPIPQKQLVQPAPPKVITFDEAKNSITEDTCSNLVRTLCDSKYEGRMSAQKGNEDAAQWIADQFKSYGLKPGADNGTYFQTFPIQNFNDSKAKGNGKTANIIGVLPGGERTFMIGAHMDHLGYGPKASQTPNRREIHPGADDNASGTAAMMELARAFGMVKGNKHTIIFIAFSGEEMGLVGADYYVNKVSLGKMDFMINYDMVGRFKQEVMFFGAGSLPQFKKAAAEVVKAGAKIRMTDSSGGGSDHASFARKGIPVTFFHTGQHNDYHTPGDTPDKINYRGLKDVAQWTFHYCWLLDNETNFQRVAEFTPEGSWKDHDRD